MSHNSSASFPGRMGMRCYDGTGESWLLPGRPRKLAITLVLVGLVSMNKMYPVIPRPLNLTSPTWSARERGFNSVVTGPKCHTSSLVPRLRREPGNEATIHPRCQSIPIHGLACSSMPMQCKPVLTPMASPKPKI